MDDTLAESGGETVTVGGTSGSLTVNAATLTITDDAAAPTKLATPTGVAIREEGATFIVLFWEAVANADGYEVRQREEGGSWSDWSAADATSVTGGLTHRFTGLTTGLPYYLEVRATSTDPAYLTSEAGSAAGTPVLGTLTIPQDLTATPGHQKMTLTWTAVANATSYWVNYTDTNTYDPNDAEQVTGTTHTFTGLTNGQSYTFSVIATVYPLRTYHDGHRAEVTGTPAAPVISIAAQSVDESAGETTLALTRTGDTSVESTVAYAFTAGTATAGGTDYTATDGTATFAVNSATATVPVTIVQDAIDEGAGETFTVTLSGPTAATLDPDNTSAVITITDDDGAATGITLAVDTDADTAGDQNTVDEDGTQQTVTVRAALTGGTTRTEATAVTVTLTAGGTATGGGVDYTLSSTTIEIAAGATEGTATLDIVDDTVDDDEETIEISATASGGLTVEVSPVTLTITDDDGAATGIALAVDTDAGTQGDQNTVDEDGTQQTVTVRAALTGGTTRTGATAVTVTVAAGTATLTTDYTVTVASPFTITIPAGTASATGAFTITPVDDAIDEPDETLAVTGTTTVQGLTVSAADPALTIIDAEATPTATLVLTPSSISENAGVSTVTATLSGASSAATTLTVSATAVDPAVAGDFTLSTNTTLTIAAEATTSSGVVTITAVDNSVDAANKLVTVSATASNDQGVTAPADQTLTITDDDATAGITVGTISGDTTEAGGTATFTVVLDSEPTADVSIGVSSDDTTEGTVAPATLTFTTRNWDTAQTVTVTGVDDDVDDGDQTYTIVLAAATSSDSNFNGADPDDVSVTNTDDDAAPTEISLRLAPATVTEGGGAQTVTVHADVQGSTTFGSDTEVTVTLTAGTATLTDDYAVSTVPGAITIAAGAATGSTTFAITPVDDTIAESGGETVTVGGTSGSLTVNPATLTISDADTTPTVPTVPPAPTSIALGVDTETVAESAGTGAATITATLDNAAQSSVTVTLTASGTATGGGVDYTLSSTTITIPAGATDGTATLDIVDDAIDEGDEKITISATASGSLTVEGSPVTLTITDDDTAPTVPPAPTSIALGVDTDADVAGAQTEVAEGATATVTVTAAFPAGSTPLGTATDVAVTVAGGGDSPATGGGVDFDDVAGFTVTIPAGETSGTASFDLTAAADDAVEGDETVRVSGTAGGFTVTFADITITDDDLAGFTVGALSGDTTEGGGTAAFTVALDTRPDADVVVGVSSSDTTEGTVSPLSLIFTAADYGARTVTVTGVDDEVDDGDQSYTVELAAAVSADPRYSGLDPADVTVTNINDDARGITVSVAELAVTEGAPGATYTVVLDTEPTENVTVAIASDKEDIEVSPTSLAFTAGNWDEPQAVTVTAGEDEDVEDETAVLTHTASGGDYGDREVSATVTVAVADSTRSMAQGRLRGVNEAILPELARSMVSGVTDAVSSRLGAAAGGVATRQPVLSDALSVFGSALRSGGRGPSSGMAQQPGDFSGRGALAGQSFFDGARSNSGGTLPSGGVAQRSGGGVLSGGGRPLAGDEAQEDGDFSWRRALAGKSFALNLSEGDEEGEEGGGDGLVVWGAGDWRRLSLAGGDPVDWDGELFAGHVGLDAGIGSGLRAGAALSRFESDIDYITGIGGGAIAGVHESRMTSVHPYVGRRLGDAAHLWATAGYGAGRIEIDDGEAGRESGDTTLWSGAVGGGTRLVSRGALSLDLKGEAQLAHLEVDGNGELIEGLAVEAHRLRLAVEGSRAFAVSANTTLKPFAEAGLRWDGDDGETGAGMEVGGGLGVANLAVGLTAEVGARTLVAHAGRMQEWGVSGFVQLDPGADGRGPSLRVAPTWGESQSGLSRLWDEGTAARAVHGGPGPRPRNERLDAELGWGLTAFGGAGLLTPYGGTSFAGAGERSFRLGGRLALGNAFGVSLEGTRSEGASGKSAHGVVLVGEIGW